MRQNSIKILKLIHSTRTEQTHKDPLQKTIFYIKESLEKEDSQCGVQK